MRKASPLHRLVLVGWLTVVWVTLWGSMTLANVGGGLLIAVGTIWAFPPSPVRSDSELDDLAGDAGRSLGADEKLRVRPLSVLGLVAWFLWGLVVSTWQVAVAAVTPPRRSKVRPEVIEVTLVSTSPVVTALVSNAITLTPGTLTLEARGTPAVISVHGMFVDDPEAVRTDVREIERRVVAAVGTRRDRSLVAAVDSAGGER